MTLPIPKQESSHHCPKEIAKQRYLTRNLKGREADDEVMFEKRYEEYMQENEDMRRISASLTCPVAV
jgi:hypothetical protein